MVAAAIPILIKARNRDTWTRDEEMKPEELFRLARSGPTVDESRANDCGSGAGREEGVRGTRRAAQQVRNKGRGPLVLSGYVHGKPFYLYKDGTTPTPSKVGRAAAEAGGSSAVRKGVWCGAARQGGGARTFPGGSSARLRSLSIGGYCYWRYYSYWTGSQIEIPCRLHMCNRRHKYWRVRDRLHISTHLPNVVVCNVCVVHYTGQQCVTPCVTHL